MLTAHEMKAEILASYKNELGSREEERKNEHQKKIQSIIGELFQYN